VLKAHPPLHLNVCNNDLRFINLNNNNINSFASVSILSLSMYGPTVPRCIISKIPKRTVPSIVKLKLYDSHSPTRNQLKIVEKKWSHAKHLLVQHYSLNQLLIWISHFYFAPLRITPTVKYAFTIWKLAQCWQLTIILFCISVPFKLASCQNFFAL